MAETADDLICCAESTRPIGAAGVLVASLSGANELLLSPHVDKLFDRHWISFDSGGELIWQHEAAG